MVEKGFVYYVYNFNAMMADGQLPSIGYST